MKNESMQLTVKIYLSKDDIFFGAGPAMILELIEKEGSMHAACKALGMSYSKCWNLVNRSEKGLNMQLVRRKAGGCNGGGSELTVQGKQFLEAYKKMRQKIEDQCQEIFNGFKQETDRINMK